jgi:hypothetical protein
LRQYNVLIPQLQPIDPPESISYNLPHE